MVLSPEEVRRLLDAAPDLKYKMALRVAYGVGLCASEGISLKVSGVDSCHMVIWDEQGKGCEVRSRGSNFCAPGGWRSVCEQ